MQATIKIVEPAVLFGFPDVLFIWIPFFRRRMDVRVQIDFDGQSAGEGSYFDGVAVTVQTSAGPHELHYRCSRPVVAPLNRAGEATVRLEVPEPGIYEYRLGLWTPDKPELHRLS